MATLVLEDMNPAAILPRPNKQGTSSMKLPQEVREMPVTEFVAPATTNFAFKATKGSKVIVLGVARPLDSEELRTSLSISTTLRAAAVWQGDEFYKRVVDVRKSELPDRVFATYAEMENWLIDVPADSPLADRTFQLMGKQRRRKFQARQCKEMRSRLIEALES